MSNDSADDGKYERFKRMDEAASEGVNDLLRSHTHFTAREWAIARVCAAFQTETGVEMQTVARHLPDLVPFFEEQYTPAAVNDARQTFEEKVRMAGATFLYGVFSDTLDDEAVDEMLADARETSRVLLDLEGAAVDVDTDTEVDPEVAATMAAVHANAQELQEELADDGDATEGQD